MQKLKRKRAHLPEDKELRLEGILAVAEKFLLPSRRELPSASEIARRAGIAKGTLYLYFRTKEEIYLELLKRKLMRWVDFQKAQLSVPAVTLEAFIAEYVRYCDENPGMLFLAGLLNSILEQNVDLEVIHKFKTAMAEQIGSGGELVVARFGIKQPLATRLFLYSYFLAVGLWQHTHPNQKIQKLFDKEGVRNLKLDFKLTLSDSLLSLWQGSAGRI